MSIYRRSVLPLAACVCWGWLVCAVTLGGAERPVSGTKVPGYEAVENAVTDFLGLANCQAATIAISKDKKLVFSRGFGWADENQSKPVAPDALMRIASVTKPITAAAIRNAVRAKRLSLDTKVFRYIDVKLPKSQVADTRIYEITVAHLLEHKGGWDREHSFDPMFRNHEIEREFRLSEPARPVHVIEYMLRRPLQFGPGEKSVYSNFGYCVLGRVLEKALNKSYYECIQESICRPLSIQDIKMGHSQSAQRDAREVWYPVQDDAFSVEMMDAHGGLIASAPALCRFLDVYWLNGDPRLPGQWGNWTFFGSVPGTTALVRQRRDGINYAVLLNNRRDRYLTKDNSVLLQSIDQAIDEIKMTKAQ